MANVKYSSIVTDIKGRVAGHVFKGSNSGSILLTKPPKKKQQHDGGVVALLVVFKRTVNPNGLAPGDVFAQLSSAWQSLTPASQAAWAAYAGTVKWINKIGGTIKATGYAAYMQVNSALLNAGGSSHTTPPASSESPNIPTYTFTTCSNTVLSVTLGATVPTNVMWILSCSRPIGAGVTPSKYQFCCISYFPATTTGANSFFTNYVLRFGTPIVGNYIWVHMVAVSLTTGKSVQGPSFRLIVS